LLVDWLKSGEPDLFTANQNASCFEWLTLNHGHPPEI